MSIATYLNNLAAAYSYQGKYTDAQPLLERALAIDEKTLGINHASTLTDLNNLVTVYTLQGKDAEAANIHKKILGVKEAGPS